MGHFMELDASHASGNDSSDPLVDAQSSFLQKVQNLYRKEYFITRQKLEQILGASPDDVGYEYSPRKRQIVAGIWYEPGEMFKGTPVYRYLPFKKKIINGALEDIQPAERNILYIWTIDDRIEELRKRMGQILEDPIQAQTRTYDLQKLETKVRNLTVLKSQYK